MTDVGPSPEEPASIDPDIERRRAGTGFRVRPRVLAAVAAGGLIGAPARYELGLIIPTPANGFPWATLLINVSGSLLLGVLVTLIVERWPPTLYVRPFAATGVLGAYTTWSTYMVDIDLLLRAGRVVLAAGYAVATMGAGLAAVYAGIVTGRRWPGTKIAGRPG